MIHRYLYKPLQKFSGLFLLTLCFLALDSLPAAASTSTTVENGHVAPGRKLARQAVKNDAQWTTVDHSKVDELQQNFYSGEEISQACISCHSEAASQFHKTIHWTWLDPATEESKKLGKGGLSINNF